MIHSLWKKNCALNHTEQTFVNVERRHNSDSIIIIINDFFRYFGFTLGQACFLKCITILNPIVITSLWQYLMIIPLIFLSSRYFRVNANKTLEKPAHRTGKAHTSSSRSCTFRPLTHNVQKNFCYSTQTSDPSKQLVLYYLCITVMMVIFYLDTFCRPTQQSGVNLLISALLLPPFPNTVLFLVWFSFCLPAANYFFFFLSLLQLHLTEILHQHLDTINILSCSFL